MKLTSLEIPEQSDQLADWLERQLVGIELGDLVTQLQLADSNGDRGDLDALFGERLRDVIESGLARADAAQLEALLREPALLLELQERVFVEGGPHWQRVGLAAEHRQATDRLRRRVAKPAEPPQPKPSPTPWWASRQWLSVAVAACVLVVAGVWATHQTPPPAGWGFERSGLLARQVEGDEYLNLLADAADEWFNKRPDNAADLEKRLQTFSHGCDVLLAAEHPQLSADDRDWLRERCRAWQAKIDEQIAALAEGNQTVAATRDAADSIVRRMVDVLRERASELEDKVS